jgi:hypothetical protein
VDGGEYLPTELSDYGKVVPMLLRGSPELPVGLGDLGGCGGNCVDWCGSGVYWGIERRVGVGLVGGWRQNHGEMPVCTASARGVDRRGVSVQLALEAL